MLQVFMASQEKRAVKNEKREGLFRWWRSGEKHA